MGPPACRDLGEVGVAVDAERAMRLGRRQRVVCRHEPVDVTQQVLVGVGKVRLHKLARRRRRVGRRVGWRRRRLERLTHELLLLAHPLAQRVLDSLTILQPAVHAREAAARDLHFRHRRAAVVLRLQAWASYVASHSWKSTNLTPEEVRGPPM